MLQAAVSLSALFPSRRLPDIAIDLIDTTGARVQFEHGGAVGQTMVGADRVALIVADWTGRPPREVIALLHASDEPDVGQDALRE